MNFKYYDLLNFLVIGALTLGLLTWCGYTIPLPDAGASAAAAYLLYAYPAGYLVGALGSMLQNAYNRPHDGDASVHLLDLEQHRVKGFTGLGHIRFYDVPRVIDLLKSEDPSALSGDRKSALRELFLRAKRVADGVNGSRLQDFNAQLGFTRSLLTLTLLALILQICSCKLSLGSLLINLLLLALCYYRYLQRDFYYCKEVLDEYLRVRTDKTEEAPRAQAVSDSKTARTGESA